MFWNFCNNNLTLVMCSFEMLNAPAVLYSTVEILTSSCLMMLKHTRVVTASVPHCLHIENYFQFHFYDLLFLLFFCGCRCFFSTVVNMTGSVPFSQIKNERCDRLWLREMIVPLFVRQITAMPSRLVVHTFLTVSSVADCVMMSDFLSERSAWGVVIFFIFVCY